MCHITSDLRTIDYHAAGEEGMADKTGEHTFELEATDPVGTGFLLR
jgi:hypothetical protein